MIQARSIGCTVFLDHEDMAGCYHQWEMPTAEAARRVEDAINEALADAVTAASEEVEEIKYALEDAEYELEQASDRAAEQADRARKAIELANVVSKFKKK